MGTGVSKSERKAMETVAKHMRYNVAIKTAVIKGQKVEYFSGKFLTNGISASEGHTN